jgi:CubicO group peptidase (beta-lactamase class C family)
MARLHVLARFGLLLALAAPCARAATPTPAPPTRPAPDDRALVQALEARLKPLVARGDLSGQLLVLRRGRVLLERSYGRANAELGVAVTPETRFNIASVTKPMTSVLAIQLIAEHRLGLRDSLSRWIPGFPNGDSIRIEHLMRHRSGIPHEIMPDSVMTRPFAAAEVVRRAMTLPLDFPPGSRSSYSSGGFEVLARVLELASGRSYAQLLDERVFHPLGMTHSSHADSRGLLPERAQPYVPGADGIENAAFQDLSGLVGAGSVWSTARDLHRFVEAVVTGKLGEGPRRSFAGDGELDFNGRTSGFKAWARWDSTSGVEAIFVGNLATGAPDALRSDLPHLVRGEPVAPLIFPELRRTPTPENELRRWEGVYQIEHGPRIELRVREGVLYANDWVMLPTADGGLFSPRDYGSVKAVQAENAKLERLDWRQGSDTYPAKRVGD